MIGLAAGDLNRQIIIQKRVAGIDSLNQPNGAYTAYKTCYANIRGDTGMGAIREGMTASVTAYSFRIRYDLSITDDMRVSLAGDIFDIVQGGVKHDKADKNWTDMVCHLGGNNG